MLGNAHKKTGMRAVVLIDEYDKPLRDVTEEELYSTFEEQIKAMAVRYKTTEEGMKYKLKRKFDGYHFSPICLISIILSVS